jgi:hypothetical protein
MLKKSTDLLKLPSLHFKLPPAYNAGQRNELSKEKIN